MIDEFSQKRKKKMEMIVQNAQVPDLLDKVVFRQK